MISSGSDDRKVIFEFGSKFLIQKLTNADLIQNYHNNSNLNLRFLRALSEYLKGNNTFKSIR